MMNSLSYRSIHNGAKKAPERRTGESTVVSNLRRHFVKFFAAAIVFVVLFSGMLIVQSYASESHPAPAAEGERIISVSSGDTLWEIARRVQPQGTDLREVVYEIKLRNGLSSSVLRSGQTLIVPEQMD
ncbi:hypothetical protein GCM10010916_03860 [Paenibacillus abyssi]|uniref:LysM domain-containing protein n=2 Tax=Paenibacillus abyssi TaxID=1340531 RepID=A0A917CLM2_9BACL|nr:hypothetical protein GCM10010916_03860 [Paenibacillus abyssi]